MTIEKKYLNKAESAARLGISVKKLENIKCQGFLKEFNINFSNSPRFRIRDLDYYTKHIKHIRKSERDD